MSNQCELCTANECKTALIDSEGFVVATIIANHDDDFEILHNSYEFETTIECCDLDYVSIGDKYDSETNTFIDKYYFPAIVMNENGKFTLDKSAPWTGHPDYVAPEPEPELTDAEKKLQALGLTKEDLQSLLA
jgi:hypothetical protein